VECGSVLSRSVVIRTPADAAVLAGIAIIDGSLSVTGTDLTELELPRLVQVRGALEIENDDSLVRVAMPALQAVDAELTLAGNPRLTALEMPALQRVGGLTVDGNAALPDLNGVAELNSVVHDLTITGNGALGSADLAVTRVGGALTIVGNPQLTRSVWSLRERLSRVRVASNDRLDTVEVTVLEFGADLPEVSISSNPVLRRIALSAFAPHTIAIEDNPALIEAVVTTDLSIRGDVMVRNNGPLQLIIAGSGVFGLPTEIAGSLTLSGPVEEFRSTQPLVIGGDCTIDGTRLIALDRATSLFRVGGTLRLIDNARLATIFTLGLGGGLEVGFDALEQAGLFFVVSNPRLPACEVLSLFARVLSFVEHQTGNDDVATCLR
jgi:hypothetical protein